MPQSRTHWTLEMVHALPDDGNRYELVDGELLVSPAPARLHQRVLLRLYELLAAYVRRGGEYEVFVAPLAVIFSVERELQPDLSVWPLTEDRRGNATSEEGSNLVLAVEVLSPGTARQDTGVKRRVYLEAGVSEYWIVDPEERLVTCWRPGALAPVILGTQLTWSLPSGEAPLAIDLVTLFRSAHGESPP